MAHSTRAAGDDQGVAALRWLRDAGLVTTAEFWSPISSGLVRQLQKTLYREQLLRRYGHALAGSTAAAYVFNDADWQNIVQLEALVEFFMNFDDPWMPGAAVEGHNAPRAPGRPGYIDADLSTGWHLVLVDSFGGRLSGAVATTAGSIVTLDGSPDLAKVNPNFDTIYLPADTARPSQTYRITAVDNTHHTVTVNGTPTLAGGTSRWNLPAGVSGQLPPLAYNLGPGGTKGFDHLDGALFLVKDGSVQSRYRWNSYTSRNYDAGSQLLSSLRGNRQYDFTCFRSANAFRNYSFKITDPGAAYDGVREARFYFSTPVTNDTAPAGTNPSTAGKTLIRIHYSETNKPTGGCSSAGCIVSGDFYTLRTAMIDLYQADYAAAHGGTRDAAVDRLRGQDHAASKTIWCRSQGSGTTDKGCSAADFGPGPTVSAAEWNSKIRGTFWLVRPDERPLGP